MGAGDALRNGLPERTCPNCNREFEPNWNTRKYCSEECAREYAKKRRRKAGRMREREVVR